MKKIHVTSRHRRFDEEFRESVINGHLQRHNVKFSHPIAKIQERVAILCFPSPYPPLNTSSSSSASAWAWSKASRILALSL